MTVFYRDPYTGRYVNLASFAYGYGSVLDLGAGYPSLASLGCRRFRSEDQTALQGDAMRVLGDLAQAYERARSSR